MLSVMILVACSEYDFNRTIEKNPAGDDSGELNFETEEEVPVSEPSEEDTGYEEPIDEIPSATEVMYLHTSNLLYSFDEDGNIDTIGQFYIEDDFAPSITDLAIDLAIGAPATVVLDRNDCGSVDPIASVECDGLQTLDSANETGCEQSAHHLQALVPSRVLSAAHRSFPCQWSVLCLCSWHVCPSYPSFHLQIGLLALLVRVALRAFLLVQSVLAWVATNRMYVMAQSFRN